jgi:glycosyltransferase involved in cell wall biosynthesis
MPTGSRTPPSREEGAGADLRLGYLIPEFPGQTHIWRWREIDWMRRFGADVNLFSTRPPPARDAARHAFADEARKRTFYLAPMGWLGAAGAFLWGLLHPWGLLRCVGLALSIPVDKRPLWKTVLPLVLPACRLAREARRRRIRHLHIHSCAKAAILGMMVRRLNGTPFSMTLNADIGWWGGAMPEKMADADFTIAITKSLLEEARAAAPDLDGRRILLGRIGVDTARWVPDGRRSKSPIGRIVSVSRLVPTKGQETLLAAVSKLAREGMKVELKLIGDGPQRQDLENLTLKLGLQGVVTFLGSLAEHEIIEHLKEADLFVLASHAEPLGVVYMEAMSMEVPTIGTRAGGVGEIIADGVDGLLVPPKDPDALAEAIRKVLSDPALGARLGTAGRKSIVERFDSRIGAATLYERIMGKAPVA